MDTLDQAMIETLTVKMKEVILEIIEGSKININQVRKANSVPAEPPSEVWVSAQIFDFFFVKLLENLNFDNPEIVIMIDDDSTESFNREQRSKLDLKGQMLYEKVKSQFPEWDIVEGIEISEYSDYFLYLLLVIRLKSLKSSDLYFHRNRQSGSREAGYSNERSSRIAPGKV